MNRKDFIKGSCGVCMALGSGFLLNAVLSGCTSSLSVLKTTASNNLVAIPLASFAEAAYKLVRVKSYNYDLAVRKMDDGTYLALVLECTHAGQPLTKTGDSYYCALHGSQFSMEGKVQKGPAERDMRRLMTAIEKDNLIIKLT